MRGKSDELKPKNGILFYEEEIKNENAPEMTGRIHIECPECGRSTMQRLAGWWHQKGRKEWLKLSHSDFQKKGEDRDSNRRGGSSRGGSRRRDDDDDDRGGRRGGSYRRDNDRDRGSPREDAGEDRPPLDDRHAPADESEDRRRW